MQVITSLGRSICEKGSYYIMIRNELIPVSIEDYQIWRVCAWKVLEFSKFK